MPLIWMVVGILAVVAFVAVMALYRGGGGAPPPPSPAAPAPANGQSG